MKLRFVGIIMVLATLSASAAAQGVTGTVSGTVKDQQGGVVPGVPVTLTSEARGTRLAPVVTNSSGDFVVPNLSADTYTLVVEMSGFKTLKRTGLAVSPGARIALGAINIELGQRSEEIVVVAETPTGQTPKGSTIVLYIGRTS
jgi:hypothetical protein